MRHLKCIWMHSILMFCFLIVTPMATAEQLLLNPSFEISSTGTGQPENWNRMNGERIISGEYFPNVDPPAQTYPDGKQIVRAYVTSWGLVYSPQGWYQHVAVIPGATYELAGYVWTSMGLDPTQYRFPIGRIGADLDGVSQSVAEADIWCVTPGQIDEMEGWTRSHNHWSLVRVQFTARTNYLTVYIDSMTYGTWEWMGVHFDLVTLNGPKPEPPLETATPYPTSTPTPTPTIPGNPRMGSAWTRVVEHAPWKERNSHASAVFNDQLWVLSGYTTGFNETTYAEVWSSTDGIHWPESPQYAPWHARSKHSAVVYGGKMWIFGGRSGDLRFNDIWSTADGSNWELVTANAPWTPRYGQEVLVHDGKIWLLGGTYEDWIGSNEIWTTTNGVDWELVRNHPAWFERHGFAAVSFNGRIYLFGGVTQGDVWSSADGITWRMESLVSPWRGRHGHRVTVYDGKMILTGGYPWFENGLPEVWTSTDGAHWIEMTGDAPWPGRGYHQCLEFKQNLWILGGAQDFYSRSGYNDIWIAESPLQSFPVFLMY